MSTLDLSEFACACTFDWKSPSLGRWVLKGHVQQTQIYKSYVNLEKNSELCWKFLSYFQKLFFCFFGRNRSFCVILCSNSIRFKENKQMKIPKQKIRPLIENPTQNVTSLIKEPDLLKRRSCSQFQHVFYFGHEHRSVRHENHSN